MFWDWQNDEEINYWCKECGEKLTRKLTPGWDHCWRCRAHGVESFRIQNRFSRLLSKIIPGHAQLNDFINENWYRIIVPLKNWLVEIAERLWERYVCAVN